MQVIIYLKDTGIPAVIVPVPEIKNRFPDNPST
jgi:hypothetical protein